MLGRIKNLAKRVIKKLLGRSAPAAGQFSLNIDEVTQESISGWVAVLANPSHRAVVQLVEEGVVVSEASANILREDVLMAGIGDGQYGFSLPTRMGAFDVRPRIFSVVVDGKKADIQPIVIKPRVDSAAAAICVEMEQRMEALLALHSERMLREVEQIVNNQ